MTREEKNKRQREYYLKNKEIILAKQSVYNEKNKHIRADYQKMHKKKIKERAGEYYKKNKETIKEHNSDYYNNNKDFYKEYYKKYVIDKKYRIIEAGEKYRENNKEKIKECKAKYYKANKEKTLADVAKYYKNRRDTDPVFRTKTNYRNSINSALKRFNYTKKSRTHEILGCSYEDFHKHLESQFEPWMTWDNRGLYKKGTYNVGWDVDHIIPTSTANTEAELIKLFHYTNLRPLCSKINRDVKKAKYL